MSNFDNKSAGISLAKTFIKLSDEALRLAHKKQDIIDDLLGFQLKAQELLDELIEIRKKTI